MKISKIGLVFSFSVLAIASNEVDGNELTPASGSSPIRTTKAGKLDRFCERQL